MRQFVRQLNHLFVLSEHDGKLVGLQILDVSSVEFKLFGKPFEAFFVKLDLRIVKAFIKGN